MLTKKEEASSLVLAWFLWVLQPKYDFRNWVLSFISGEQWRAMAIDSVDLGESSGSLLNNREIFYTWHWDFVLKSISSRALLVTHARNFHLNSFNYFLFIYTRVGFIWFSIHSISIEPPPNSIFPHHSAPFHITFFTPNTSPLYSQMCSALCITSHG